MKNPQLNKHGELVHLLSIEGLPRSILTQVLDTAASFVSVNDREVKKVPLLRGRSVFNLFFEHSTRTRTTFEIAATRLSADVINLDIARSSASKGESLLDTIANLSAMAADIFVVRHSESGAPYLIAQHVAPHVHVINAGDGRHAHPTQGLLDMFTIRHYKKDFSNLTVAIVGDVLHSRVARSNLWALTACGAEVVLCGPPTLVPDAFADFVAAPPPGQRHDPVPRRGRVQVQRDLDAALQGADAVMTLRLQQERMQQNLLSSLEGYHQRYGLSHARLQRSGRPLPVLHPGPVNRGVEMTGALLDDPAVALVDEQVRNGIPVRMALLYLLAAGGTQSILNPSSSRP